jgi:hypothetical protein
MAGMAGWNHTSFQEKLAFALEKLNLLRQRWKKDRNAVPFCIRERRGGGSFGPCQGGSAQSRTGNYQPGQISTGQLYPEDALNYLNRLSYLCFLLLAGQAAGSQNQ